MSRGREMTVTLSVLDRLSKSADPSNSYLASVRAFKEAIRQDLEDLLNTRRVLQADFEGYPRAQRSVLNYGLTDLGSLMLSQTDGEEQVLRAVERSLAEFEPRLGNVHVEVVHADPPRKEIRLHIEATIPLQPNAEAVSFDTMLDLASGLHSVG